MALSICIHVEAGAFPYQPLHWSQLLELKNIEDSSEHVVVPQVPPAQQRAIAPAAAPQASMEQQAPQANTVHQAPQASTVHQAPQASMVHPAPQAQLESMAPAAAQAPQALPAAPVPTRPVAIAPSAGLKSVLS